MKPLFIPVKIKSRVNKSKLTEISKKFPKQIAIAYSIQYENIAKDIKKILSKTHKITNFSQVLGCTRLELPKSTKAILLISDGKFHAISLAYETKLPVYLSDHDKLTLISQKDIEILEKKKKAAYIKFLHADKLGILVTTKPGQQNLKKAIELKDLIENKKSYLFLSNNINTSEFENFGLNCWINTACPKLDFDDPYIMNYGQLNLGG